MKLLSVNAGSSSLKFNVIELPERKELINGYFQKVGLSDSFYYVKINGEKITHEVPLKNHLDCVECLKEELFKNNIIIFKIIDLFNWITLFSNNINYLNAT